MGKVLHRCNPFAVKQAEAIRAAASHFLQALTPEQRGRITFVFPVHEVPTAAKFARTDGPNGSGGRPGGNPPPNGDQPGGVGTHAPDRPSGPGQGIGLGGNGPGPNGGPPGGFAFVGEKYGQAMWTNFPVSDVPRPGLRLGELTEAARNAAHAFLRTILSPMGHQKVVDIMAADQTLADSGTPYASGLDVYTLALFGQPSATAPWMLQFGGHHLGLNVTFVGDKAVLAPLHTGILPAKFQKGKRIVRALGRENDKAFDLPATLAPDQLKSAVIEHQVSDLVRGPGYPTAPLAPEGLRGDKMTDAQREILFAIAREWVGMLNDAHCAQRLNEIRKSLPDTWFAWSGPTVHEPGENGEAYFRIHGPSLLIEHAPQGNQGGYKMHVHTVMRDLNNDYAKKLLA